jgi:transcription initiation factor IIE alpha subunit
LALKTYEEKLAAFHRWKRERERQRITVDRRELQQVIEDLMDETPGSLKQAEQFADKYLRTKHI